MEVEVIGKQFQRKNNEEQDFRRWYARWAKTTGIDPNPDAPEHFYDYRAAFRAGEEPKLMDDGAYHWPSQFKRKGHPNRFVEGIDTITELPVR